MSELLNPRKMRQNHEVEVDLLDGTHVIARKEDMTLLLFEGRVPLPMLSAVQKMLDMPNASVADRISALADGNGMALIDMMREHACRVVIKPVVVMYDDGNPDHLPVNFFDTPKLMLIWNATALVPSITTEDVMPFRERSRPVLVDAVSHGPSLPAITQRVDSADIEFQSR